MKTVTEICREVCKREKGKKEVNIAQVREIIGIMSDLMFDAKKGAGVIKTLNNNGKRRFTKRMKETT